MADAISRAFSRRDCAMSRARLRFDSSHPLFAECRRVEHPGVPSSSTVSIRRHSTLLESPGHRSAGTRKAMTSCSFDLDLQLHFSFDNSCFISVPSAQERLDHETHQTTPRIYAY
jgi:hypothetical protein